MRGLAGTLFALVAVWAAQAATFTEDFAVNPATRGWQTFGDSSLFVWSAAGQNLQVTWNSSRPNSYFHRPLGVTVTRTNDFSFAFDLRLSDITLGVTPGKPATFQIAAGFLNSTNATGTGFFRGTGTDSPNLVEWDYFPDSGFGATVSPTIVSSNNQFYPSFSFPFALTTGDLFRVTISYTAATQTLRTTMTRNGQAFGPIRDVVLDANFSDFRVDTVAFASYSDAGQPAQFAGSVLAHATVDNLVLVAPDPPPTPPVITTQPAGRSVLLGGTAGFTVVTAGTAPFNFQWRRNGTNLVGATAATLTLVNVQTNQAGSYTVFISNVAGSSTSAPAALAVTLPAVAPGITVQPASRAVTVGGPVMFSVTAGGTAPLLYQWRYNNADLAGANATSLTLTNVQFAQAGGYTVFISNVAGTTTSTAATLTVYPVPLAPTAAGLLTGGRWRAQFTAEANCVYILQRSGDFLTWIDVADLTNSTAAPQQLEDVNPPAARAFYRLRAQRP